MVLLAFLLPDALGLAWSCNRRHLDPDVFFMRMRAVAKQAVCPAPVARVLKASCRTCDSFLSRYGNHCSPFRTLEGASQM